MNETALCIRNDGYLASLEAGRHYVVLEDAAAEQHGLIRVIDESGLDYLYPASYFQRSRPSKTRPY